MQIPRRKSDEFKKRDDGPVYLTNQGFKRLQERLLRLKSALPNFITEAQRTAAYGDRSDNAEYKEAKSTLRRTHRQILSIQDQIKRAAIIKTDPNTSGKVQLGSTVVLEVDGMQKIFQIVGSHETDPAKGRISYQSPLGAALMNRAKNNIITIYPPLASRLKRGSGSKNYRILEIR